LNIRFQAYPGGKSEWLPAGTRGGFADSTYPFLTSGLYTLAMRHVGTNKDHYRVLYQVQNFDQEPSGAHSDSDTAGNGTGDPAKPVPTDIHGSKPLIAVRVWLEKSN